jgi:hypothetical protein
LGVRIFSRLRRAATAPDSQIYTLFFFARSNHLISKHIVFFDPFFWAFAFFSAQLRVKKPCFLPLFSIIAKTLQQAKPSKNNVVVCICGPPRADVTKSYGKKSKR